MQDQTTASDAIISATYRYLRKQGYRAQDAMGEARAELALRAVEGSNLIRFTWEVEYDPTWPADWGWDAEHADAYMEEVEAGRIEVLTCAAEVGREIVASLGDVHLRTDGDPYRRQVERELAREAGVI